MVLQSMRLRVCGTRAAPGESGGRKRKRTKGPGQATRRQASEMPYETREFWVVCVDWVAELPELEFEAPESMP